MTRAIKEAFRFPRTTTVSTHANTHSAHPLKTTISSKQSKNRKLSPLKQRPTTTTTMMMMIMKRRRYYALILTLVVFFLTNVINAVIATDADAKNHHHHHHQKNHHDDDDDDAELSTKIFIDCLNVPIEFVDDVEETNCNTMIDSLTAEELNIAAKTSYAYWYLEQRQQQQQQQSTTTTIFQQQQIMKYYERQSALREAKRHLLASNGQLQTAIKRIQNVCQYRKEQQLDLLRVAFSTTDNNNKYQQQEEEQQNSNIITEEKVRQIKQYIQNDMEKQAVIMRRRKNISTAVVGLLGGNDDDHHHQRQRRQRPIMVKYPRKIGGTTYDEYMMTQLYIAEKANAVIEYLSHASNNEKMIAIFDFKDMSSKNSPPISWQTSALSKIQLVYPERVHKLIVLEPPLWIRGLYISIKPFMSKATSEKIQIVTDRSKLCGDILDCDIDDDNNNNNIISMIDEEVDVNKYLNKIPFYCPYYDDDDCNNKNNNSDEMIDSSSNFCCNSSTVSSIDNNNRVDNEDIMTATATTATTFSTQ